MSKSKGNVLDPLELIDRYGADALRFTLTALAAQGRDIKLSAGRIEGYRNFVTKIWNASRYAEMNGCAAVAGFDPASCELTVNRWIAGELAATERHVVEALEGYRFNDAAQALYRFTWHTFCDWYLEFTKPILADGAAAAQAEVRATTGWALDALIRMLHPIMPFVTEELWAQLAPPGEDRPHLLIAAPWPTFSTDLADAAAKAELDWVVRLISEVRAVRSEMNVPPSAKLTLLVKDATPDQLNRLETHGELIMRVARLAAVEPAGESFPKGSVQAVVDGTTVALPLGEVIDIAKERERLAKELVKLDGEIDRIEKKLGNEKFISRAPADVVEEQRERRSGFEQSRVKLSEALDRLASA
jgi:valyl-tRNA synthetase